MKRTKFFNVGIRSRPPWDGRRRGVIILLATAAFVMILAFAAFSVDVGYIALTKAQLQNGADAGVLAAAQELPAGLTVGAAKTPWEVADEARAAAVAVVAEHRAGDKSSIYADGDRDVRFGQVTWDPLTASWQKTWGATPYNLVEVTLRRDQVPEPTEDGSPPPDNGDQPLPLFFSPVIGHTEARLLVRATSAIVPGNGFHIPQGSGLTAGILPITLDEPTWDDLIHNGIGTDDYTYDPDTGAVSPGADGILEVSLYPYGNHDLPPGNRGTVDFGGANNSTSDLERQILNGVSEADIAALGFELSFENGSLSINGDTGISAGIKDELEQIKGVPRAIPLFSAVSGNGNNANYTIERFVGIRVVDVKLTGNPKRVIVQPAPFSEATVTKDESGAPIAADTIFTRPLLIE
ncbi:MAG: Tad domain-containing protein [Planctomycetes bacterium]|nr:Tad domain-containing protein [Planctomycetota bacterium]